MILVYYSNSYQCRQKGGNDAGRPAIAWLAYFFTGRAQPLMLRCLPRATDSS